MARAWLVVFLWVGTGCPSPLLEPTEGQPPESQNQNLTDAGADFSSGASRLAGAHPKRPMRGAHPQQHPVMAERRKSREGQTMPVLLLLQTRAANLCKVGRMPGRAIPWTYVRSNVDPSWVASTPVCQEQDWLAKYFHYRNRLNGTGPGNPGFVQVGVGAGPQPAGFPSQPRSQLHQRVAHRQRRYLCPERCARCARFLRLGGRNG